MPNPDEIQRDGPDASAAMSEGENQYNDPDSDARDEDTTMTEPNHMSDGTGAPGDGMKKKYDPKDPFRPRRKKARRACYACQRAHLTCGDERPCQRCVKRGLAEACQDGVRKKAKYLHDAPPEALLPVLGPNYNPSSVSPGLNGHNVHESHETNTDGSVAGGSFASMPTTAPPFPVYSGVQQPVPEGLGFSTQQSPVSPSFQPPRSGSLGGMAMNTIPEPMNMGAIFDPSNPALFNFDIESLNFGSQYPAMEFGMLGHMSSSAEANPSDPTMSRANSVNFSGIFGGNGNNTNGNNNQQFGGPPAFDGSMGADFAAAADPSGQGFGLHGNLGHGLPHAYAVAAHAGSAGLGSPSTDTTASPQTNLFDASPTTGPYSNPTGVGQNPVTAAPPTMVQASAPQKSRSGVSKRSGPQSLINKRPRDSSFIYEAVKEPYPYTNGFHNLIAFLQKRFSANNTLRIAKSLASIRPSFISCTKTLNRQDLIFMEKCFQRTLFEYEDFMQHCSAPTIVCRRTGEVAAVNKEFTALTGWTKDVLLGKEPNLNVNTGGSTGPGRSALATPRPRTATLDTESGRKRPQPVFIPELLDDESVVEFYEDFAHMAFENSRGHVNRKCRLLKYQPRQDGEGTTPSSARGSRGQGSAQQPLKDVRSSILSGRVAKIDGEHGIQKIEKDGKVDCTYCWVIKRDVFDIPMLMVVNFLPCYYRNEEPHQLAV
ncbi:related to Transcription activator of gluconeogenesis NECHADRAFT_59099 [Cephalotrichum gorgonifer]|uniref:Related to Transcription activator of gluconeogenesis NECHADRAFT_59099 n=1 Tax=Cephalotrichum gorgonifer TaxID=2041049 RepID=A0AAE8N558_9PEZI|nr:related to Transcription activator of gluconeogenesis NECHADRAFT_59099 [Cephalotrichum gorgonifer]